MSEDLVKRLEALETRMHDAEDRLEIMRILASYGPIVDSCKSGVLSEMWAEGGAYELQGYYFERDDMDGVIDNDLHRSFVASGSAHVFSLPHIELHGDRAVAIHYSNVFIHEGDRWIATRTAGNRWDFERTPQGWKVRRRVNLLADGNPMTRALLAGEEIPSLKLADD